MTSAVRLLTAFATASLLLSPSPAGAHCDTLAGPVVSAARAALAAEDVTPALVWVRPSEEADVRRVFDQTLVVRRLGREAQELADRFFFETLVRLHRFGEGEPYTGLQDAVEPDPALEAADRAIETGQVDSLLRTLTDEASAGLRERFAAVRERSAHRGHDLESGRAYVAAYVSFIHYVEVMHEAAAAAASPHAEVPSGHRGEP